VRGCVGHGFNPLFTLHCSSSAFVVSYSITVTAKTLLRMRE